MKDRLFIMALVAVLGLSALPNLAATPAGSGSAATTLGVAYAGDDEPTPTPTATPALPDGSCQGGGQCGG